VLTRFRDFFAQGNVIRLAAAVIIGTTFAGVVTTVVNNWVGPLFASFGGANPNGLAITLIDGNSKSVIDFGAILTSLSVFLVLALIVYYFVVLPVKELELRRMLSARFHPPQPTAVDMLDEIKGMLSRQQLSAGQTNGSHRPEIEVTEGFATRLIVLPNNTPGLVIEYGSGQQLAFTAGRGENSLVNAHEFAVSLAYTALAFASRCRVEMAPRHAAARRGA
jgi:large conductance mechanosensitive channel